MTDSIRRKIELFEAAIELPPEQRQELLEQQCGGDARLLESVLQQLAKDAELGDWAPETQVDPFIGTYIGPYLVKSLLGEGGYGSVYLAERQSPMTQQVALKIIRLGRDSKSVLARFDQERQALALMDHPNIARVFDAGATPQGRPYFVMEYVAGEPITEYCDRNRLSVAQRLELFIAVCEAVQHAHQKAIIHRDLKPRNILVSQVDGKPVAKVIDFGIAKATGERLIDQTIETMQGVPIGTLLYMSPEQAEAGKQDVDTRSDVYSLGVVLYELLAGSLPHDAQTLLAAGQAEMHRIIREVDPPTPSTRLETIDGQTGTAIGTARGEDRSRLAGKLRKELEWIPMMALRKDRSRRYDSAAAMAADVRRYLEGKPLEAASESRSYLVRKFVRRNRVVVVAGIAILLALVLGLAGTLWQANRASERATAAETAERAEKERADQLKQVSDFQSNMLDQIDTTEAGADLMKDLHNQFVAALEKAGVPEKEGARQSKLLDELLARVNATDAAATLIDRTILRRAIDTLDKDFLNQPVVESRLRQALADSYIAIGLYAKALPLAESALATRRRVLGDESRETLRSIGNIGFILQAMGMHSKAEPYYREALDTRRRVLGVDDPETLIAMNNMGFLIQQQGRLSEAEPYFRDVLQQRRRLFGDEHLNTLTSINNLGNLLRDQGKLAEAEPYFREALATRRRVLGDKHEHTLVSIINMGILLRSFGKLAEAEPYYVEALEISRQLLGEKHPETLNTLNNLGFLLMERGKLHEADSALHDALENRRLVLGEEHTDTITSINNLGLLLQAQGRLTEAKLQFFDALERSRRVLGNDHPKTLSTINNIGFLLRIDGNLVEAERYSSEAMEKLRIALGEEHPNTLASINNMGMLYRAKTEFREATDLLNHVEPVARRVFSSTNPSRFASFLTNLGRARIGIGYEPLRFAIAEANLLEAHPMFVTAKDRGATNKEMLECVQALIDLYTAWDKAEPSRGYDAKAAQWQATLDAAKAPDSAPADSQPNGRPTDPK